MPPSSSDEWKLDLSNDVKYLLQMASAISNGFISVDLANIKPGPVAHSRWLTKASRILRLYVATSSPTSYLKTLAEYVIRVYVPMYFNIKYYNSVIYGSTLLFKFIRLTQFLPLNVRQIVYSVVQNNSYFAHPENVMLSMLYDDRKSIRDQAIQKILYYRNKLCDAEKLREYKKCNINFDCCNYFNMIDLDDDSILSEPPITRDIPYDHLKEYLEFQDPPLPDPQVPCHIQGTERCVKLLTSVSRRVTEKNRESIMAVTDVSRKKNPRLESRQDLKT